MMIKEIAQIFDRYDPTTCGEFDYLIELKYQHEAEVLYENFEDLNIYDEKSLRQYVQVILADSICSDVKLAICDDMIRELHSVFFKY